MPMNMETFMGPDPSVGASLIPQQQQLPPSPRFKPPERFNFSGGMPQPPMGGAPMGQPQQQAQQPMMGGMNPQLFQQLFAAFLNRPPPAPRQPVALPPSNMPQAQPQSAAAMEAFRNAAGEFDPWEGMGAPPAGQGFALHEGGEEDPKYAAIRARQRARQAEIAYFSPKPPPAYEQGG